MANRYPISCRLDAGLLSSCLCSERAVAIVAACCVADPLDRLSDVVGGSREIYRAELILHTLSLVWVLVILDYHRHLLMLASLENSLQCNSLLRVTDIAYNTLAIHLRFL